MSERSPRLRGLKRRARRSSPRTPDRKSRVSETIELEGSVNRATEDREREAETSETLSDDELHIAIKDEQEESALEDKSEADKSYECKTCKTPVGFTTLVEYLQHLRDEHKEKGRNYDCPHCDFVCQHPKTLGEHFNAAHKDSQDAQPPSEELAADRCAMCPHVAASAGELEAHQRVHHLKRRFFRCTKCTYMTHVRARYTKHVKYHSMPMIKCDDCDFRTPYKWNLDRHTRNHGGGGTFQCRACSFTADIRQSLTVHETNHHEPPVGQANRRLNTPFERKLRNGPKRYNQVGASDFRDLDESDSPSKNRSSSKSPCSDGGENSTEEQRNAIAGADCIALKCEEKGCQFITAWDSEMQRHLAESHAPSLSPIKRRKPMPMLIPLSPDSDSGNSKSLSNESRTPTPVKVPRVRVRPELAKIARDTEIAKLYNNREPGSTKKEAAPGDSFEKRNASFFDKLKERLMSTSASIAGVSQVAVSSQNDLKCWCTYKASSQEELASHSQTHHTALSVSIGISRCPKCRRRCKTSDDLRMHMNNCQVTSNDLTTYDNCLDESPGNCTNYEGQSYSGDFEFPFHVDWDGNYGGLNSSGSSVESHTIGRRVFKCPHCPFWASTASRFHVHIVGHLNRKPFECSLCAYRSNWRWDITKHIKLKAARDPAHMTARVLMTDETGRRNYSKYNKYLAQGTEEGGLEEEGQTDEAQIDEPPTKVAKMSEEKDFSGPPELTPAPAVVDSAETNSMSILTALNLRPPPPLKSAGRSQGQSLLKTNPSTASAVSILSANPHPVAPSTNVNSHEETKRTLWKCKRCNFRSSSKETVLTHVKTHYETTQQANVNNQKKEFTCSDCPYISDDATAMAIHRIHHRPNLEAIFKCYLCPYYVSTKKELLEHARLHGEELAVVHQRSIDSLPTGSKRKASQALLKDNDKVPKSEVTAERNSAPPASQASTTSVSSAAAHQNANIATDSASAPPLMLDTRALPDTPLVWVSRPDGTLTKMLKCRHCPYVSSRRVEVRDHETMHASSSIASSPRVACPDCSFTCSRRDVIEAHADMHMGSLGTVHCLVDENRTDAQQLEDLATLLGFKRTPALGPEPDLHDSRLVHCCSRCPARFLCEKELRIHLRYHSTQLAYSCEWCSYAARQPAHLSAHQKAHSSEYQEHTRHLLSMYGHSQRYAPPGTACVEASNKKSSRDENSADRVGSGGDVVGQRGRVAWVVVDTMPSQVSVLGRQNYPVAGENTENLVGGNQVFTCAKCPARYFKLDALEYHMTLHGSNNRFKCAECDYSSKTAQNLMKHQVVHRRHGESIEPAGDILAEEQTANRQRSHGNEGQLIGSQLAAATVLASPNFPYPACFRNGRLKEKRYKCHKCPSAFEKREQYRVHLTLHGAKQRYRCDKCDYSVKYYANYAQHMKKHEANAQASQTVGRNEPESINVDRDSANEPVARDDRPTPKNRRKSTISSAIIPIVVKKPDNSLNPSSSSSSYYSCPTAGTLQPSNQDKQSILLMQKKGLVVSSLEDSGKILRCQECPFSSFDKDAMDSHKRRHGIERLTPPCPHCNYVPRKDENLGEHIRLHFTRLYKPESYLIVELLALTMRRCSADDKDAKFRDGDLLFRECKDGKYLPTTDVNSLPQSGSSSINGYQEKVIVDPSTGETKHRYST